MRPWSRYNTLFRSEYYGWVLHNTLSGIMLELDEAHRQMAESILEGKYFPGASTDVEFVNMLEKHGFLADPDLERLRLMEHRYRRNTACFGTGNVSLTICPTLACNFACSYCFENSQTDTTVMDDKTMDAVLAFIGKHKEAKNLSVSWYGGEPTLAFGVIEKLTEKFIALFPDYAEAGLLTNGYLLDKAKIDRLSQLRITSVQITIDGSESTHDRRRKLRNEGGTYRQILRNIDELMCSEWNGKCNIRVNIDRTNMVEFAPLRQELVHRYRGKNLSVYAEQLAPAEYDKGNRANKIDNAEWSEFQTRSYKDNRIVPPAGFYPATGAMNTCVATCHQSYVVGPKGELYKCTKDVGRQDMSIGTVHKEGLPANTGLVANYSISTDPFDDRECLECKVLPVCGGGCVNKRMRVQQFGEGGLDFCSPLKESLEQYLSAYLDSWYTLTFRNALFGQGAPPSMKNGYRMVQPEKH